MTGGAPAGPSRVVRRKRQPSPTAPLPATADSAHSSRRAARIGRSVLPPLFVGMAGSVLGTLELISLFSSGGSLFSSGGTNLAGLLLFAFLAPVVLGCVAALVSAPRARFIGLISAFGGIFAGNLVLAWLSALGAPDAPRGGLGASVVLLLIGFSIGYGLGTGFVTSRWRND